MTRYKNTQRFVVRDGDKLIGTNTAKGMLEGAATKKANFYNTMFKTKRFKVMEIVSCRELDDEAYGIAEEQDSE